MQPTELIIPISSDDLGLLPYYAQLADADLTDITDPSEQLNTLAAAFEKKLRAQAVSLAATAAALTAELATHNQYEGEQA